MTRKEQNAEVTKDFQRCCLEFRIRCANEALPLASLPEFVNAVRSLEGYRDGYVTRDRLMKVYRDLNKGRKTGARSYGYTAASEIYRGLLGILYRTLHPKNTIWSFECQRFTEAAFIAAGCTPDSNSPQARRVSPFRAEHNSYIWQERQYKEIFEAHRARIAEWEKQQKVA